MNINLEEASEKYAHNYFNMHETNNYKTLKQGFEAGFKFQQEVLYTEQEVLNLLLKYQSEYRYADNEIGLNYWFKQNKK